MFTAEIFRRLLGSRNVLTWINESSCFRTFFQSQRVHVSQAILKSARQHFYPNFPLRQEKLSWKRSLSLRSEISVLLVNTLTSDHMHSHQNWENFAQHVQRPLSQKSETFSPIFIEFSDSSQTFSHFHKKDQVHSLNIWEIIESEKSVDFNAWKLLFEKTLPESTCSHVTNNVEICTAELLS